METGEKAFFDSLEGQVFSLPPFLDLHEELDWKEICSRRILQDFPDQEPLPGKVSEISSCYALASQDLVARECFINDMLEAHGLKASPILEELSLKLKEKNQKSDVFNVSTLFFLTIFFFKKENFSSSLISSVVLASFSGFESVAYLIASLCCAHLKDLSLVRKLAFQSLSSGDTLCRARAACLVGLCDARSNFRKDAQAYFAMASRFSRSHPALREEQRLAQKLLLSLHFSS